MKRVYIVFRPDGSISCLFGSKKTAEKFCKEFGYTFETYSVD